jgi:hypothetical protein
MEIKLFVVRVSNLAGSSTLEEVTRSLDMSSTNYYKGNLPLN